MLRTQKVSVSLRKTLGFFTCTVNDFLKKFSFSHLLYRNDLSLKT